MQTIALIVGDDSGKGVIETAEEPDDRFDDMTLIGQFSHFSIELSLTSLQSVLLLLRRTGPINSTLTSGRSDWAGICIMATGRR